LRLTGRRCVVVGGGAVATRRIVSLTRAGAQIVVVAPEVTPQIQDLAAAGGLMLERRRFQPADLDGAFLTMAATDDPVVNGAVAAAAQEYGVLVTVADDSAPSDFSVPALVRRKDITLSVSTGGRSPAFTRHLREQLEAWLTEDRCILLELATELRRDVRAAGRTVAPEIWQRAINDDRVAEALAAGDRQGARRMMFETLMAGR
jgi:siroheme synthase-like protein